MGLIARWASKFAALGAAVLLVGSLVDAGSVEIQDEVVVGDQSMGQAVAEDQGPAAPAAPMPPRAARAAVASDSQAAAATDEGSKHAGVVVGDAMGAAGTAMPKRNAMPPMPSTGPSVVPAATKTVTSATPETWGNLLPQPTSASPRSQPVAQPTTTNHTMAGAARPTLAQPATRRAASSSIAEPNHESDLESSAQIAIPGSESATAPTPESMRTAGATMGESAIYPVAHGQPVTPPAGTIPSEEPGLAPLPDDAATADALDPNRDLRPITELGVNIRPDHGPDERLPGNPAASYFAQQDSAPINAEEARPGPSYFASWEASGYYHQPLYFEQVNLERFGLGSGVFQPAISAAHFFGTIPLLPYKIASDPPWNCEYTLGHFRPGTCAPPYRYQRPIRLDGALVEGAVITGAVFLLP